jgi:hypothetical protein
MCWCTICKNISRNDFTIIFWKKYDINWLYRDFFFYISQYFWQMTVSLWFPSILLKKISKTTIIIDGPSSLFIRSELSYLRADLSHLRADLSSLTGRLVSVRVVRGPSCLVPLTSWCSLMTDAALVSIDEKEQLILVWFNITSLSIPLILVEKSFLF